MVARVIAADGIAGSNPTLAVGPTDVLAVAYTTFAGVEQGTARQLIARSYDGGRSWAQTVLAGPFPAAPHVVGVLVGADQASSTASTSRLL